MSSSVTLEFSTPSSSTQKFLLFHGPGTPYDPPTAAELDRAVSLDNPDNPFSRYIGNRGAVARVMRVARESLGEPTRDASNVNMAVVGGASTGKTFLVKSFAKLVGLPFIEISPKQIKTPEDLIEKINDVLKRTSTPSGDTLELRAIDPLPEGHDYEGAENFFVIPPCVLLIDEVHALRGDLVQALLKATEPKDRLLQTTRGTYDTSNVSFWIATTDLGLLFDAFVTRFAALELQPHGKEEITQIIALNYPDLPPQACAIAAHRGGDTLREILMFVEEMRLATLKTGRLAGHGGEGYDYSVLPGEAWVEAAHKVAAERGIDEHGMSRKRVAVLESLAAGPMAQNRLPSRLGVKPEEMDRFILPPLLAPTADRGPLVEVSSKGMGLTREGKAAARLRGFSVA